MEKTLNELIDKLTAMPDIWWVGVVLTICMFAAAPSYLDWWRGRMLRKARESHVFSEVTYDFVNSVEERVASGSISREEAKEIYVRLKRCFPIKDLFPSPTLLKEAIQKRINSGVHAPVPLPGSSPKRKHCFET